MNLNLPNTITAGRILAAPFIAALPFIASPGARLAAFVLYIVAAVTDYYDGKLARTRNLITDLGRLLDPLADKLLLFATLIPMFVLMAPANDALVPTRAQSIDAARLQFITPFGQIGLPWWIVVIVIGREIFMTIFRHAAARRKWSCTGFSTRSVDCLRRFWHSPPRKHGAIWGLALRFIWRSFRRRNIGVMKQAIRLRSFSRCVV